MATKTATAKKVFNGKDYTRTACASSKSSADSMAKSERSKGYKARVVKDTATGKHCVYVRKTK